MPILVVTKIECDTRPDRKRDGKSLDTADGHLTLLVSHEGAVTKKEKKKKKRRKKEKKKKRARPRPTENCP